MPEPLERIPAVTADESDTPYQAALSGLAAHELVFAVVGPVGSGTSQIASDLNELLEPRGFKSNILKAREVIEAEARPQFPPRATPFQIAHALQDAGDQLRKSSNDNAVVAVGLVELIRKKRAEIQGDKIEPSVAVEPDGSRHAYILDSIRHPEEVELLRRVYQDAFCLIGVFCEESERLQRLTEKFSQGAGKDDILSFMGRDENAPETYGQQVSDAFHLSDYFVDNTVRRIQPAAGRRENNPDWDVPDQLGRLVEILTRGEIVRPSPNEMGMFHAYGARMRSSCLSRQVGAALLDRSGTLIATGTNEVPRAGGGLCGSNSSAHHSTDFRCHAHNGFCTNTMEQNRIREELIESVRSTLKPNDEELTALEGQIGRSPIGQLLEFSRSVHAEMDALLSAGRNGIPTVATKLFVTTFPCHNCARHIVAAGVEEVQYIEPYLKSKAIPLHGDAIVTDRRQWISPFADNQGAGDPNVLFRPFIGVAPRLYRRAFLERKPLKDPQTGYMVDRGGRDEKYPRTEILKVSYPQVEAYLTRLKSENQPTP
ncbi:MAG: anti-phage dCTP deaminase [Gammaproteobacteria bacterium]|nr:anti-phage dCTP deaminase [Gammaproteobacteria bacterium]